MTLVNKIIEDNEHINTMIRKFNDTDESELIPEEYLERLISWEPYSGNVQRYQLRIQEIARQTINDAGTPDYLVDINDLNGALGKLEEYLNTSWRQFKSEPISYARFEL